MFAIIDIETTGLDPHIDKVCELAVIWLDEHKQEIGRFQTLINPNVEISPELTAIHGITNQMVARAPVHGSVWDWLKPNLGSCIIVGYNVQFDIRFLDQFWQPQIIDLLPWCRRTYKLPKYTLEWVAVHLGLASQSHRALADCELCRDIFQRAEGDITV